MTVALEASGNYVFLLARSCFGVLTRFQRLGSIFVRRSLSCARSFVGHLSARLLALFKYIKYRDTNSRTPTSSSSLSPRIQTGFVEPASTDLSNLVGNTRNVRYTRQSGRKQGKHVFVLGLLHCTHYNSIRIHHSNVSPR